MAIHLNKKSGAPVYHRNGESSPKNYTIFGENGMMNHAYVFSDEDSDSQGMYTMPTKTPPYFNNEINQLNTKKHVLSSRGLVLSLQQEKPVRKTVYDAVDRPVILSKNKLSSKKVHICSVDIYFDLSVLTFMNSLFGHMEAKTFF